MKVHADRLPGGVDRFDDQAFALDLLERKHVLVAPGSSFNVPYRDHFRVTLLPDAEQMTDVFGRIESLLDEYAARESHAQRPCADLPSQAGSLQMAVTPGSDSPRGRARR